jgi:hypothetical protein
LLVATGPRLFDLEGDLATPIALDWDDPETSGQETEPACPPELFMSVDSANGVAFVVGCGGVVFRVALGRAERVALGRGTEAQYSPLKGDTMIPPPTITAVRALCPDVAVFGSAPSAGLIDPRQFGTDWFFDAFPAGGAVTLEDYPPNKMAPIFSFQLGPPLALLGSGADLMAVFGGGSFYAFGDPKRRAVFGEEFRSASALPGGVALIGTGSGRLLLVTMP